MSEIFSLFLQNKKIFVESKDVVLQQWIEDRSLTEILKRHAIDKELFFQEYAASFFDFFIHDVENEKDSKGVSSLKKMLFYLRDASFDVDEVFEMSRTLRCLIIDIVYKKRIDSRELLDEVLYLFDEKSKWILKFYAESSFLQFVDTKERFFSNISHEIRTPLNAILGFVNLLIDENLSKKHKRYLEIILNSSENLLRIVNDVLDLSKLKSGKFTIEPKLFSLHDELMQTIDLFGASANMKDITISSFIDHKVPQKLYGDSVRIKQIVSNFISNAIKFTQQGGAIEVEAVYENGILKISVSDNGIGIDIVDLKKVFKAFTQAEKNRNRDIGGTGLGLSIAYQLAELMQGRVQVASVLGKGSTFWVEIPLKAVLQNRESFAEEDEYKRKILKKFAAHLLVAEDNEANQELIKTVLAKYGITCDLVSNGIEACDLYKKKSYDLILMDEEMPLMNGTESVKRIIEYEKHREVAHTPVVLVTANVFNRKNESIFDICLRKPLNVKELESIFLLYLKEKREFVEKKSIQKEDRKWKIEGIAVEKLLKKFSLTEEELLSLLKLFITKMQRVVFELRSAIKTKEYRQIAMKAHSIKGSSGNFCMEEILKYASEMEQMAKKENENYNYEEILQKIEERIEGVKIL